MKKIQTEIYSRVSGYYRPVNQWNAGKREEYEERNFLKIPEKDEVILWEK
jgi:anaerobic ribonucleoside-triphosphate reductase